MGDPDREEDSPPLPKCENTCELENNDRPIIRDDFL